MIEEKGNYLSLKVEKEVNGDPEYWCVKEKPFWRSANGCTVRQFLNLRKGVKQQEGWFSTGNRAENMKFPIVLYIFVALG